MMHSMACVHLYSSSGPGRYSANSPALHQLLSRFMPCCWHLIAQVACAYLARDLSLVKADDHVADVLACNRSGILLLITYYIVQES